MNAEPTAPMGGVPAPEEPMPPMDGQAPAEGGEEMPPMDAPAEAAPEGEGDDSTMGIINQLSPKDKEAVRAYAESMLARDEQQNGEAGSAPEEPMPPMDGEMPPMDGQAPVSETVIFKKKQLDKVNEIFGGMGDEEEKKLQTKRLKIRFLKNRRLTHLNLIKEIP